MKKENLFEVIGSVDDKIIQRSNRKKKLKRIKFGYKFGAAAACFLVAVGVALIMPKVNYESNIPVEDNYSSYQDTIQDDENRTYVLEDNACGFALNNRFYFPISFEKRKEYGLVEKDARGLTEENTYHISQNDIGNKMGVVEECSDEWLIGSNVYHYNAYSESDGICIVEYNGEFKFYTFSHIVTVKKTGINSNTILNEYGVNLNTVVSVSVIDEEGLPIATIQDSESIEQIIKIISAKDDIGLSEHEQLLADKWYETYGTQDVYYDGESMQYNETDDSSIDIYEKAHELWNSKERQLKIVLSNDLEIRVIYTPIIKSLIINNCYYTISDEERQILNSLLDIEYKVP